MWWLVYRYRETTPPFTAFMRAKPVADHPFPTVTATGIASAGGRQWWIEETEGEMPPARTAQTAVRQGGARTLHDHEKPPYRVPTLAEIREIPWNGLNVVSTFASSGGSSTGYRMAGCRVLAAVEFIPAAADSYRANCAEHTKVLETDVRQVTGRQLLRAAGLRKGELDILDGSPPCEPFSSSGRRDATWGQEVAYSGTRQRTDDLFLEFARLVDETQPRVFVAENVEGLVKGRAKGYFKRILQALRDCGYTVEARLLDAAWLGVPQFRRRVIFVGVRNDLKADPAFPTPLPYCYTVREALPHIFRVGRTRDPDGAHGRAGDDAAVDRNLVGADQPHDAITGRGETRGAKGWCEAEDGEIVEPRGGHGFTERRSGVDRPAPTIMAQQAHSGNAEPFIEHDERRQDRAAQDVSDRPAPTVVGAKNSGDLQIVHEPDGEAEFFHDPGGNQSDAYKNRQCADMPAPTITNGGSSDRGAGAANTSHYQIEEPAEFDEMTVGNDAFEPKFGPPDDPHPTVLASGARTSGELRDSRRRVRRRLTIPELIRICGFPDDYTLTGTFGQQWERLGDAVPPPMMHEIAKAIAAGPLAGHRGRDTLDPSPPPAAATRRKPMKRKPTTRRKR